ncbi:protein FAM53A-like isoform X3 [Narcine bancroftii]|uniref:protein FAM53A-like isoform X3 n=1 Tax=Narcine bancroftii TaxID=1343680 RepID=UPI0038321F10
MVTVITEQLQKQSLDDLACKVFNINLPLPENTNKGGCCIPYRFIPGEKNWNILHSSSTEIPLDMGFPSFASYSLTSRDSSNQNKLLCTRQATNTWMGHVTSTSVGNLSDLQFSESFASLPDPPTKRHCRSLSVPEDLSRCRSLWKPAGSKVWTPVKRRCNSGGTGGAQLCNSTQRPTSLGLQQLSTSGLPSSTSSFTFSSLTASPESPLPWMLSPNNHSTDIGERTFLGVHCILPEQSTFIPQRRFSLSPVHIREAAKCLLSAKSTPSSTPEMNRRQQGLLRSHSQPCDLNERKCGVKRRHDDDVRWTRPALDFFKMNQRRNLSSPACLEKEEKNPLESESPVSILDSAGFRADLSRSCQTRSCWIETLSESEEEEDAKNCGSTEAFPFHRTCEDLDLDMIEEN